MGEKNTEWFGLVTGQCESVEEYESLVKEHRELYVDWKKHIAPMLHSKGLNGRKVAQGCNVSVACASKFARMIPAKRENVIMLAMMLGMNVRETDELLTRWAKFQKLYSKHPMDAIWIYLIEKGGSDRPYELFEIYRKEYDRLFRSYNDENNQTGKLDTKVAFETITGYAHKKIGISDLNDETFCDPDFSEMMRKLIPSFADGYRKLMDKLESYFVNVEEIDTKIGLSDLYEKDNGKKTTANIRFKGDRKWLDMYYRKIRELEKDHIIPSRTFLIALGIRLDLDAEKINELLECAGMGRLCPKDRLEGSIVFYLEEMEMQFPSYFNPHLLAVDANFETRDYNRNTDEESDLMKHITIDVNGYPDETLQEYIKRRIEESNIFDSDEQKQVRKFLELL